MRVAFPRTELFDRAGMIVSVACGIHCVFWPMVVSVGTLAPIAALAGERAEWWFIGGSACLGMLGHASGYFRHHGRLSPLIGFLAGMWLVLAGRLWFEGTSVEPWAVSLGGICLALSHWVNLRWCDGCASCPVDEIAVR
jgi:hypothetical protein